MCVHEATVFKGKAADGVRYKFSCESTKCWKQKVRI